MTLNQILRRIKTLAEAHQQVRTFEQGRVSDFLVDQTTLYPAVFLQQSGGLISLRGHAATINYRLFFVNLVHVSEDSKQNEVDVQSDMVLVALDLLTQMNNGNYNDWILSSENNLQLLAEQDNDLFAGCYVDISIRTKYTQDRCIIPTNKTTYQTTD